MVRISPLFLLLSIIFGLGCNKQHILDENCHNSTLDYLFMAHTYDVPNTVDERILCLNLDCFEQIWLGGDICLETTQDYETIDYLDQLFDLSSPNCHWALGNHDIRNGNVHWITDRKQRPTFYSANFNGITLLVLNTNFFHKGVTVIDTVKVNEQFDMIQSVCDTIQASSHLILLSHGQMWKYISQVEAVATAANADYSNIPLRINPTESFASAVYPLLQQVASRGITVINIAGDFGQYQTEFEAVSPEGIHFLGSGITADILWSQQFPTHGKADKFLVLHHDLATRNISWTFETL